MEAHIKEHPAWFHRFEANWTPTVLILDSKGSERHRIEGYLPKDEFQAQLEMALARLAFDQKKFADAERLFGEVAEKFPQTSSAPEAIYWGGVSKYSGSHDHTALTATAEELQKKAPESVWAKKATPWLH